MKDLKEIRLLSLLAALGLLYVGIDRIFFDRIVGADPLSTIQRILTIAVGILLGAISVSLLVVAWRGRFPVTAMNTNSITEKLLAYAFCAAPSLEYSGLHGRGLGRSFSPVRPVPDAPGGPAVSHRRDCKQACGPIFVVLYFLQHAFLHIWYGSVGLRLV